MASIDVHGDVGKVELLERIGDTLAVARGGVLASLLVGVGDQVWERIGLDDESNRRIGVLLEDGNNGWEMLVSSAQLTSFASTYGQCTGSCRC